MNQNFVNAPGFLLHFSLLTVRAVACSLTNTRKKVKPGSELTISASMVWSSKILRVADAVSQDV
jgi:hypothetical protein